jgi:hypothetical protein
LACSSSRQRVFVNWRVISKQILMSALFWIPENTLENTVSSSWRQAVFPSRWTGHMCPSNTSTKTNLIHLFGKTACIVRVFVTWRASQAENRPHSTIGWFSITGITHYWVWRIEKKTIIVQECTDAWWPLLRQAIGPRTYRLFLGTLLWGTDWKYEYELMYLCFDNKNRKKLQWLQFFLQFYKNWGL